MQTLTLRRYLVLGVVTLASAFGDTALAVGMKRLGPVPLSHPDALLTMRHAALGRK